MRPPILFSTGARRGRELTNRWRAMRPAFVCVLAHTDTCLIPGISSAGLSEELRPITPAADAEVVLLGQATCIEGLPSSPLGAPGPAGITRAALQLADLQATFYGAGLSVWPQAPCVQVSVEPGGDIRNANAVPSTAALYAHGLNLGQQLARTAAYVVIGESVPGGTTTALAVLLALGYRAGGRVSGSMPGNAHALKLQVATTALNAAGIAPGDARGDPLAAVAKIGDPMQPLVAGVTLGASSAGCDVLMAGGSQMLAVAALVSALQGQAALDNVAIGTTRWIVQDPAADAVGLARDISQDLPLLAANLDFSNSRHEGLRAYERFLVKEGVGAGGGCVAAMLLTGRAVDEVELEIDAIYDRLLGRLQLTS